MSARARFILAVIVLFLLMTGPFLLTALIVWAETEGTGIYTLSLPDALPIAEVAKGLALGADAYMTKPFSTRELVDKVRSMLEQ